MSNYKSTYSDIESSRERMNQIKDRLQQQIQKIREISEHQTQRREGLQQQKETMQQQIQELKDLGQHQSQHSSINNLLTLQQKREQLIILRQQIQQNLEQQNNYSNHDNDNNRELSTTTNYTNINDNNNNNNNNNDTTINIINTANTTTSTNSTNTSTNSYRYYEIDKLDDGLNCSICLEYLINPVIELNCGQMFCRECIKQVFKSKSRPCCPLCNHQIKYEKDIVPAAKYITNKLDDTLVCCTICNDNIPIKRGDYHSTHLVKNCKLSSSSSS